MAQILRSEPLHILHIIPYYDPAWAYGGPVRVASEIARRTASRGHTVTVLTTDALDAQNRAAPGTHIIDDVSVHRYRNLHNGLAWRRLFLPLSFGLRLDSKLRAADVAHVHDIRSLQNVFALGALKRARRPYLVSPHGGLPADLRRSGIKRIYDRLVGHELLARATRLHALTHMEREQYTDLGYAEDRIVEIPNGIDVTAFNQPADGLAFRRQFDIPPDSPVVGFLGRLSVIKGLEFLVDAFAALLADYPDAVLVLAGPDDGDQPRLEAQIRRLGIERQVRFTGYLADPLSKASAYRAYDVYVLPSRYEIQSITILESLLNETPGILTDRCGLAGYLAGEELAYVVSFADAPALTQTLYEALTQPRIDTIRGRQFVSEHFNWDTLIDRWIDLYYTCAESGSEEHSR